MPAHRKDARARAMYDLYCQGLSLAGVARAFGTTRQAVYKMLTQRGWPLRPRPKPLPFISFGNRRYTLRRCGYYGATDGQRGYLHRDVWEASHGPIPQGFDIHHRDGNRANNALSNLELFEKAEHSRRFSTGHNQHTHPRLRHRG